MNPLCVHLLTLIAIPNNESHSGPNRKPGATLLKRECNLYIPKIQAIIVNNVPNH